MKIIDMTEDLETLRFKAMRESFARDEFLRSFATCVCCEDLVNAHQFAICASSAHTVCFGCYEAAVAHCVHSNEGVWCPVCCTVVKLNANKVLMDTIETIPIVCECGKICNDIEEYQLHCRTRTSTRIACPIPRTRCPYDDCCNSAKMYTQQQMLAHVANMHFQQQRRRGFEYHEAVIEQRQTKAMVHVILYRDSGNDNTMRLKITPLFLVQQQQEQLHVDILVYTKGAWMRYELVEVDKTQTRTVTLKEPVFDTKNAQLRYSINLISL